MGKEIKRYSIDQCALYKCRSKRRLEQLLYIEAGGLKEIDRKSTRLNSSHMA